MSITISLIVGRPVTGMVVARALQTWSSRSDDNLDLQLKECAACFCVNWEPLFVSCRQLESKILLELPTR